MYTLVNGFYKYMVQKDEYFVLILGLDNAGKTTYCEAAKTKFTKKYKGMNPNRITTTVGLNIGKIDVDGVRLNFWDLGGQQELQSLWDKYYAECHAVIYIVDSSDRERVSDSKETFDRMIASEHLSGVPLLVLANKQDIPDCMGVHTVKPIFNQNAHLIGARDIMLMATSALNGSFAIINNMKKNHNNEIVNNTKIKRLGEASGDQNAGIYFGQKLSIAIQCGIAPSILAPYPSSDRLLEDGVDEGIRWLVDCIKRNSVDRPPRNHDENL